MWKTTPTVPPTTVPPTVPPIVTPTIPPTALILDQVNRLIIGALMLVIGFMIYASGGYETMGNIFWKIGGKHLLVKVSSKYDKQFKDELERKRIKEGIKIRKKYEKKMKDVLDK